MTDELARAGLRVKPLEWHDCPDGTSHDDECQYEVDRNSRSTWGHRLLRAGTNGNRYLAHFSSMDEAKAAAQADYEARILAALTPAPVAQDVAGLDGNRPLPIDRETLGRMVREAWVRWAETQPTPKASWLLPYDELAEPDKEADRQIGEAIARWTLIHDAARAALTPAPVAQDVAGLIERLEEVWADENNGALCHEAAAALRAVPFQNSDTEPGSFPGVPAPQPGEASVSSAPAPDPVAEAARVEWLAKWAHNFVMADRWKGRKLDALPPDEWQKLREETRQFWRDEAAKALRALARETRHDR